MAAAIRDSGFTRVLAVLAALVAILSLGWAIRPLGDVDIFTHIVLGREIFNPPRLTEAEASTGAWISWLAYWIFSLADRWLGLSGVKALNILLLWGTFVATGLWGALVLRASSDLRHARVVPLALGVATAWLVSLTNSSVRPQSFGFLGFALCLVLLELGTRRSGAVGWFTALLGATMVLWQNCHPSVLLALPVVAAYSVWHRLPPLLIGLPLVAAVCTPDGWGIFHLSAVNANISRDFLGVSEWLPPWSSATLGAMRVFWIVAVATLLGVGWSMCKQWPIPKVPAALSLLFFALTLTASRFGVFFALVSVPLWVALAGQLWTAPMGALTIMQVGRRWIWIALLLGGMGSALLSWSYLDQDQPLEQLRALRAEFPQAKIFNYREAGGILEYVGYPGWRVFIDGRLYLFDRPVWDRYHAVALGADTAEVEAVLREYDLLVLHRGFHAALIERLQSRPGVALVQSLGALVIYCTEKGSKAQEQQRPSSQGR